MSSGKKSVLGRGLSALLDDRDLVDIRNTGSALSNQGQEGSLSGALGSHTGSVGIQSIRLSQIEVNPYQPRTEFNSSALEELAESIRVHGIIQPITVRWVDSGKYQIISGERRWRAAKLAGLQEVPSFIRLAADQGMHELALIENIQREDLNPLEVALSLQRMVEECGLKQEELGDRISKSRSTVTNFLRLLRLPEPIQIGIRQEKISMGHAKALVGVEHIDRQLFIYEQIVKNEWSVRKTEEMVRNFQAGKANKEETLGSTISERSLIREIGKIQDRLSSHFGAKVSLKMLSDGKGKIEVPFLSTPDLNRILELFNA